MNPQVDTWMQLGTCPHVHHVHSLPEFLYRALSDLMILKNVEHCKDDRVTATILISV